MSGTTKDSTTLPSTRNLRPGGDDNNITLHWALRMDHLSRNNRPLQDPQAFTFPPRDILPLFPSRPEDRTIEAQNLQEVLAWAQNLMDGDEEDDFLHLRADHGEGARDFQPEQGFPGQ